jgi:hypothetical protein
MSSIFFAQLAPISGRGEVVTSVVVILLEEKEDA